MDETVWNDEALSRAGGSLGIELSASACELPTTCRYSSGVHL